MLLYMCDYCAECSDGVGHQDADRLRVWKGEWVCQCCYEDRAPQSGPQWRNLPHVTRAVAAKEITLPEQSPLRTVTFKPHAGGHSGNCPDCGVSFWTTGEPGAATGYVTNCECGASWRSTWHRHGDPMLKTDVTT